MNIIVRKMINMRDKVDPHGIRVGVINDWESRWNPSFSQEICISRINKLYVI